MNRTNPRVPQQTHPANDANSHLPEIHKQELQQEEEATQYKFLPHLPSDRML